MEADNSVIMGLVGAIGFPRLNALAQATLLDIITVELIYDQVCIGTIWADPFYATDPKHAHFFRDPHGLFGWISHVWRWVTIWTNLALLWANFGEHLRSQGLLYCCTPAVQARAQRILDAVRDDRPWVLIHGIRFDGTALEQLTALGIIRCTW